MSILRTFALLALFAPAAPAQLVLSFDDSRTGNGGSAPDDYYLTSSVMQFATSALVGDGFTVATRSTFTAADITGAAALFTGLMDTAPSPQEVSDVEAFVANGGLFVCLRDWGQYGAPADDFAAAFGVTYNSLASGPAGQPSPVLPTVTQPIWSGPAGTTASYSQIYSSSISSGVTILGTHSSNGLTALGMVQHGAGVAIFLTDVAPVSDNGGVPPSPGTPEEIIWRNVFALANGGGGASIGTNFCVSVPNSTLDAAVISATGSDSVASNSLVLRAGPLPASQPGLFFYGPNQVLLSFGNGFRCVGSGSLGLARLAPTVSGADQVLTTALDITDPPTGQTQITAGSTWYFQAWFRDPASGGAFFNLSDGLEVTFQP